MVQLDTPHALEKRTNGSVSQPDDTPQPFEIGAGMDLHSEHAVVHARFVHEASRRDLRFTRFSQGPASPGAESEVEGLGTVFTARFTSAMSQWLLELGTDALAMVVHRSSEVTITVSARSQKLVDEAAKRLNALSESAEEDPSQVPVTFWSWTDDGGMDVHQRIACGDWTAIAGGYCSGARRSMTRLLSLAKPEAGRLILWHGPPGTGKTHAIRALTRAWEEWCVPHIVTDPEKFLGDSAYAMNVLTSGDSESDRDREWQLIVLEDSGELLRADAHERTGQALSRLLNLTDGLLGQGMNALALITTNEPIGRLHPAVTRPGRCLEEVEFGPLSPADANRWLNAADSPGLVTQPTTLASLYAILNGHEDPANAEDRLPRIGFGAA